MLTLKRTLLLAAMMSLGSCMTVTGPREARVPDGHNFSYVVQGRERIHLIQAFDDGTTTYLEFGDTPPGPLDIRNSKGGQALAFTLDQRYVLVPGVYGALQITVAGESVTVVNQALKPDSAGTRLAGSALPDDAQAPTARTAPMSTVIAPNTIPLPRGLRQSVAANDAETSRLKAAPVGVPESLQTMRANGRVAVLKDQIVALEENMRRLSAALDAAHRGGTGSTLYLRPLGTVPRLVMTFEDNSAHPQVDDPLLAVMGDTARSANRIYLHGHTDAFVASETGTALAIRRTVEVRRLLISLNVEPERIRLFYRGAGNFVANNSTAEGRALNRRVEIELRKW